MVYEEQRREIAIPVSILESEHLPKRQAAGLRTSACTRTGRDSGIPRALDGSYSASRSPGR